MVINEAIKYDKEMERMVLILADIERGQTINSRANLWYFYRTLRIKISSHPLSNCPKRKKKVSEDFDIIYVKMYDYQ